MTKKEIAIVQELRTALALRWTEDVEPDVAIPEPFSKKISTGYMFNAYSARVEPACSSEIYHGIGRIDKTTSQNGIRLYSTELLALRAMRHAVEKECAEKLARIDERIAAAKGEAQ